MNNNIRTAGRISTSGGSWANDTYIDYLTHKVETPPFGLGGAISGKYASQIDKKMDDGSVDTGSVRGIQRGPATEKSPTLGYSMDDVQNLAVLKECNYIDTSTSLENNCNMFFDIGI
jgi:hypothetical protein